MPVLPGSDSADWAVRVVSSATNASRAFTRNHAIDVGEQASLKDRDASPSAIEYLLAALGGDLAAGFRREAARRGIAVDALELSLRGRLDNVLVHLGVIGEGGHAGLAAVDGTLFVGTDASDEALEAVWATTLARSPLFQTLSRAAHVSIAIRATP